MRQYAQDLGIKLLFILPGLTDELQPLDRFNFGAMKATCRRLYRRHRASDAGVRITREIAAAFLIRAWEAMSSDALEDAWALDEPDSEEMINQL
jgi:hypothetical protein